MPIVYITCCAARRHNLASFLSAAQFLTVNSGGRFFNWTPSVLLSSTSERPSTAKTTQHPDPSIDPQVDPSHPSPHPSFPLCSSDLMSRSKYWSASGPSLLRSPSPPPPVSPHGFNYDISKTSLQIVPNMLLASEDIKQKQNERTAASQFRSCVRVEVDVLGCPS